MAKKEKRFFQRYQRFTVGPASTSYKINITGWNYGTAGDPESFLYNNNMRFSTWDNSHDINVGPVNWYEISHTNI